jgi:signal peptidase I
MSTLAESWRERRDRRRVESDARELVAEARRILKKKSYRLPEAVVTEVEQSAKTVEAAIGAPEADALSQALAGLEQQMDKHLAFARKSTLREYSESIGVAVAIALLLRAFVVEAFQIPSGSMIPTLEIGDHIFVAKFSYGIGIPFTDTKVLQFSQPKRGDVIVFKWPKDREIDYIKRVVALGGEKVVLRTHEVLVNGRPMPRELSSEPFVSTDTGPFGREYELWYEDLDGKRHRTIQNKGPDTSSDSQEFTVPEGHVFVMGDNRDNSNDSRFWGTVPLELIKGRALVIWWSRGPTSPWQAESWSDRVSELPASLSEWFAAIRWRRFFTAVD